MRRRKIPLIVPIAIVLIIVVTIAGVGPMVYKAFSSRGVKTEGINNTGVTSASTDLNGTWTVVPGPDKNHSSVGFTFYELLPNEKKYTSGSTRAVEGEVTVEDSTLTSGTVEADLVKLRTDVQDRDVSIRLKLFHTDQFPTATFTSTERVDLSGLPEDGSVAQVTIPGDLTVHGETNHVEPVFDVVRHGKQITIASTLPINRLDYNVKPPEFVAALINEEGEANIRLTFEKE